MDLPWWGWLLGTLWIAGGLAGFIVFLLRFESVHAIWYHLAGDQTIRPLRIILQLIPLVAVLVFSLLAGPIGLWAEVQSRRDTKQKMQRIEGLRERRRQRRAAPPPADAPVDPANPADS